MLDWTGERFVPWADAPAVAYEHLHRYLWVAEIVGGLRVLDLASGEGYGSNIMAQHAATVTGVDIDEAAVRHASEKYPRANLSFVRGSVTRVPISQDHSFDVVVCFEAIEHIEQHEELLREVCRLLKDEGQFIVSTPNKDLYAGDNGAQNPFHVRELSFSELDALLRQHFAHVCYLGQRVLPASSLWPLENSAGAVREIVIRRGTPEFEPIASAQRSAEYFLAVASARAIRQLQGSVLVDDSNELGRVSAEAIAWKDQRIEEITGQVQELNRGLEWSRGTIQTLEQAAASKDEALTWRAHQVDDLEKERDALRESLDQATRELGFAVQELAEIHQSRGWKAVLKARRILSYIRGKS